LTQVDSSKILSILVFCHSFSLETLTNGILDIQQQQNKITYGKNDKNVPEKSHNHNDNDGTAANDNES